MNLLIATLGGTWQVIPEVLGFTNPEQVPLYRGTSLAPQLRRQRHTHPIHTVDEVWAVTTAEGATRNTRELTDWLRCIPGPRVRLYWPEGMSDIRSAEDARIMAELIHRLVFQAHECGGQVLLSLAGGRKTMSADLQRAGQILGCHALLHVIDLKNPRELNLQPADFAGPLPEPARDAFLPLVVDGRQPGSEAVRLEWEKLRSLASLPAQGPVHRESLNGALLAELERIQRQSDALLVNYRLQLSGEEPLGNFRALYALPPWQIESLRNTFIGRDPRRKEAELAWLRQLPKAELHCHLGGILSPGEMIEVATAETARVAELRHRQTALAHDLDMLEKPIRAEDLPAIAAWLGRDGFKGLHRRWPVPEPLGVCAFLLAFAGHETLLDRLIYGEGLDPARFHGIGIEAYERLGDLQGSGLLQSEATLRAAMGVLARQCRQQHIRYLELRCSPLNYTRGGLTGQQVVGILLDAVEAIDDCDIRLIFIASRHGDEERVRGHVNLARRLLARDDRFVKRFVGFDLAGAEHAGNPARFRKLFRPLHEQVIRITIHAGEGEPVENIWEAVYELNADRIGHGLTLGQNPHLLARFRDRGIAIEMCPSSNFQIVGFRDHLLGTGTAAYPLPAYLRQGLRVTVNTDDPGISRTDLTREYHKAAAMSAGGLSRWQVLQLVRNGFRAAFCNHRDRQRHLVAAEKTIMTHCHLEGNPC